MAGHEHCLRLDYDNHIPEVIAYVMVRVGKSHIGISKHYTRSTITATVTPFDMSQDLPVYIKVMPKILYVRVATAAVD